MAEEPMEFMISNQSKYEREFIEVQDYMLNRILGTFRIPIKDRRKDGHVPVVRQNQGVSDGQSRHLGTPPT